jgi:predicted ATPase/tetratricopeptide (TPR) repeat protein
LLFRLALDAGSQVGYRSLAEDLWPGEPPENARAALQSLVSRLRGQLPAGVLESGPGGYRLAIERSDVDAVRFQDLVAAASAAPAGEAAALAGTALALWCGEPWTPGEGYDWFERDLAADRATALRLGGAPAPSGPGPTVTDASPLPAELTAFVGRDEELAGVAGQLTRGRLVTILGPGGAGKTRLATEAARGHRHPIVVELAPAGPEELWQAVLGAIGRDMRIAFENGPNLATPLERATASLAGRDVLLVLDNCEHVVVPAALAARDLLQALPRLRILATSREPLGVPGEAFVPLGPLDPIAAETLFADRVLAARGRPIEPGEQDAAARIRTRLDGLPLALELAAAKARTMTMDEIADGLDDRFSLLSGGLRIVLPRHQTLRALVDWSWSLLDEGERAMLAALAIYPAGVAAIDAADVASAHGGSRSELDSLVDKSLLQRAGGRYRALETIREYGIERLAQSGRLTAERVAQARWLADASARHDARLRSAAIHDAIAWFDAEDDNLAAALRFCSEAPRPAELTGITAACLWYWLIRDRNDDAVHWLGVPHVEDLGSWQGVLVAATKVMMTAFGTVNGELPPAFDRAVLDRISAAAEHAEHDLVQLLPVVFGAFAEVTTSENWTRDLRVPDPEGLPVTPWGRALLTVMSAAMAQNRGDFAGLGSASERAVELVEETGDRWGMALAQQMRAEWLALDGRLEEALAMSDASTRAMATITSSWDLLQQQGLAVNLLMRLGRIEEANERADAMLARARSSDSARAVVLACAITSFLAIELEDLPRARGLIAELEEALAEWEDIPPQLRAMIGIARGGTAALAGDDAEAETLLRDAAEAAVESNDFPIMAGVAVALASFAARTGRLDEAETALEIATTLRGAPDPRNPAEIRVRAALAAGERATRPGERAALDRDAAASGLTQILRR